MSKVKPVRLTLADVSDKKNAPVELHEVLNLQAIAPEVVAAIIAQGVLSNSSTLADTAIEVLAEKTGGKHTYDRLKAFAEALGEHGVPTLGKDDHDTDLGDVTFNYALHWGQSGYLVGLAVGLALGSGQPFSRVHTTMKGITR